MNSDLGEFYVAAEVVGVEDGFAAAQTVPLKVAICCAVASPDVSVKRTTAEPRKSWNVSP